MAYEQAGSEFYNPAAGINAPLREQGYTKVLFVHNPGSSRADSHPEVLARLEATQEDHGLDIYCAETSPEVKDNMTMLYHRTDPDTVVLVRSGDGGTGNVLEAGFRLGIDSPFGLIPGGRKNDLANDIHSRRGLKDPAYMLTNGTIRALHPVEVRTKAHNYALPRLAIAFAYWSKGVSDTIAARVNSNEYDVDPLHDKPFGTFRAEIRTTSQEFFGAEQYEVEIGGQRMKLIDLIIANSGQMAGNMHFRTNAVEPGAKIILARNRFTGALALGAAVLGLPVPGSRNLLPGDKLTVRNFSDNNNYQIEGEQRTLLKSLTQYGGEDVPTMTFQISPRAVNVLATKRRARRVAPAA